MNVIKTDQVKDSLAYEVSIEPIGDISVMGRYTHTLKVRYEGLVVDPGFSLYLEPVKEVAVTDFMARSFGIGRVRLVSIRTVSWFVNRYRSVWLECITTACCAFIFEADSPTFTVRRLSSSSVDHTNGCDIEKSLSQFLVFHC